MELRTFEWNGDFDACREQADVGNFDAELATRVGKRMYKAYQLEKFADKPLKLGWSMFTSYIFDVMWTHDPKVKNLLEHEAKVLFLAASDIFCKAEFSDKLSKFE